MQQTALNLIAVSIFSFTFLALVGPVLNISPTIPAVITLGLLGGATIDALTWEGKGMTLLLALFASEEERERILHHEAGHFLVAYLLGIPVASYTLSAWDAFWQSESGLAGVQLQVDPSLEAQPHLSEMPKTLEHFATVWMAGIAAESIVYGRSNGGKTDRQQLREALQLSGLSQMMQVQKERWAISQAKDLIRQNQPSYESLVEAMKRGDSVKNCCQILAEKVQPVDMAQAAS